MEMERKAIYFYSRAGSFLGTAIVGSAADRYEKQLIHKFGENEVLRREGGKMTKISPFEEAPNLSIDRVEAKKRPDGVWQLFYRGTRNEVFDGDKFSSAAEARNYFKAQKALAETPWKQSQRRYKTKADARLQSVLASDRLAKEVGLEGSWQLESRVIKSPQGRGYVYEYRPNP